MLNKTRRLMPALLVAAFLSPGASAASPPDELAATLGWLQGCWQPDGADTGSTEQWSSAAGAVMLGFGRTVADGKLRSYEFMQLREDPPGKLTFIAQPSGRPPTAFPLLRHTGDEFVFENLGHDFPQRVIYRRKGDNALHASIEGQAKGKLQRIDFPMHRVACN
jgi:hypothetical protein